MTEKAYEVALELFEGPLDLLLFLVKKNDLDINNIPIAQITTEYLSYLELMKDMDLDIAGDFLVMAATLMAVKSRSLLPSEQNLEGDEGPNPAAELAQKLLEYQKFKEASKFLANRANEMEGVFYRGAPHFEEAEKSPNVSLFDLMAHLQVILAGAEDDSQSVEGEEFPIEEKMEKIMFLLSDRPMIPWEDLFADERKRRGIIACFLAMLELTKLQKIFIRQDGTFGKISIFKKDESAAEETPIADVLIAEALAAEKHPEPAAEAPVDEAPSEPAPIEDAPVDSPLESHAETEPADSPKANPEGEPDAQP